MKTIDWHGLYWEGWGSDLVRPAYSHPAKFARGLIRQIYRHLLAEGHLRPGDVVLDPFAGVACGALDALRHGLIWVGVELEGKHILAGLDNLSLWETRYAPLWPATWGKAYLYEGDSRQLRAVLRGARAPVALVSSPPWASVETCRDRAFWLNDGRKTPPQGREGYGDADGQLAAMPEGPIAAVVSSPGFAGSEHTRASAGVAGQARRGRSSGNDSGGYDTPGNLSAMAVVSSPPFGVGETRDRAPVQEGEIADCITRAYTQDRQGTTAGNLASTPSPDTFWGAARQILDECWAVLAPGAVAVWVVKRFVRDREIVDFPGQWRQVGETAGFRLVEHVRAWVVEDHGLQGAFLGASQPLRRERKSFFRRIYEQGHPKNRIDWEDVLIMRKAP